MIVSLPYQGKTYPLELTGFTLAEGFTIKSVSGHRPNVFSDELLQIDPGAVLAGLVIAMRRAGKRVEAADIDQDAVSLEDVAAAVLATIEAAVTEQAAEAKRTAAADAALAKKPAKT